MMRRRAEDEDRQVRRAPPVGRQALIAVAETLADAYSSVEAVFLFGSRARGAEHAVSDLDLAVLLDEPAPDADRLRLQAELARFVEERVSLPVDVVLVDRTLPPGLLFDIFAVETILFARDYERTHQVACRARAEYRDVLPRLDRSFEWVRQRIEERAHALNRA
jgi:predicted nucleotidyltransferase